MVTERPTKTQRLHQRLRKVEYGIKCYLSGRFGRKCFRIPEWLWRRPEDFFTDTINPIKEHDIARRTENVLIGLLSSRTAQWGWENGNNGRLLYWINNGRFLTVSQSAITPHFLDHNGTQVVCTFAYLHRLISTLRQKRSSFSRPLITWPDDFGFWSRGCRRACYRPFSGLWDQLVMSTQVCHKRSPDITNGH